MRIINAHNNHVGAGGMEVLFESITKLLRDRGHDVHVVERNNSEIQGISGRLASFGSMVYSPSAKREMAKLIADFRPDVVHLHNLYPQLSPSVVDACREANVPVVLAVQDYKLTCPTAQHLRDGKVCEKCLGGREYWCAVHNCRGSATMSVAYAVRNAAARIGGRLHDGISLYLACSEFAKRQIVRGGYDESRTVVIPNFSALPIDESARGPGDYIAYVGRISPEKGLPILIEAGRRLGVPVKIAGNVSKMPELPSTAPQNVEFVGPLSRDALPAFYRNARCLVVPSVWYEGLPVVCAEAMGFGTPLVVSDIGGLAEAVVPGASGQLCPVGDVDAFTAAIDRYWRDPAMAVDHGRASQVRAREQFSLDAFYQRLIAAYRRAATTDAFEAVHAKLARPA
jgi:glycosyltransferase involved in cell wall biosynthesis